MRPGAEYLSSNTGIAYPFEESLRGTRVGDAIMDVFVDALAWVGPRYHNRKFTRLYLDWFGWDPQSRQYIITTYFGVEDLSVRALEHTFGGTVAPVPGSSFAVVSSVGRDYGVSFTLDMDRLLLLSAVFLRNMSVRFSASVLEAQGPAVRSFSLYKAIGPHEVERTASGITGDVSIVGGYNVTVRESPSIVGGIQIDAEPGTGAGRVPCECPDTEPPVVSSSLSVERKESQDAAEPALPSANSFVFARDFSLHVDEPLRAMSEGQNGEEDETSPDSVGSNDDPGWEDWSNDPPWSEQADPGKYPEKDIDPTQYDKQVPADPYYGVNARTNVVPGPAGEVVIGSDSCYGISADLEYGVVTINGRCTACCQCDDYVETANEIKDRNDRLTSLFVDVSKIADTYGEKAQEFNHSLQEVAEEEFALTSSGSLSFGTNTSGTGIQGTLTRAAYSIAAVNASKFDARVSVSDIRVFGMELANLTYTAPSENGPVVSEDTGNSFREFTLPPGTSLRILARFVKRSMESKPDTSASALCTATFTGVNGHGATFVFGKKSEIEISTEA